MDNLIDCIKITSGRDLNCFAEQFLKKILSQRFHETGVQSEDQYIEYLRCNKHETLHLLNGLNLSYSYFFRNIIDFAILEKTILPVLFKRNLKSNKTIRIWSAACAEGEEPYSIAIIAEELVQNQFPGHQYMIQATDISDLALKNAIKGEYTSSSLSNVRLQYINKYFKGNAGKFVIDDLLKYKVEFNRYDLLDVKTSSPPSGIFGGYDIIFCCNILIYYKPAIQKSILMKVFNSLSPGGYLVVDESERSVVKSHKGFHLYSGLSNLFVKN
jgi:chemotaxis protein methyltransferase CheR